MAIKLTIDNTEVKTDEGSTVLGAALNAGIYIPTLCYHPDLPPGPGLKSNEAVYRGSELIKTSASDKNEYEGCKLCVVEIEGMQGFPLACNTRVAEGMAVKTITPRIKELRRDNLVPILAKHPHACLTCAEREGCSREPCSLNVPVNERCCPKLGNCELQRVAEYIGLKPELTRYVFRALPSLKDEPLFERNYNLCVGCLRCMRVCKDVRGLEALGFVWNGSEFVVGTIVPSLKGSECKFCGACVEVCPTGALMDKKKIRLAEREKELVPCHNACPAGIDVPRYIRLITKEKFAEAAAVIREKIPFPSVLAHICHRPCESECRRSELNGSIAICALKRFVIEQTEILLEKKKKRARATGKRVAVIGSGPAGLAAAYYLAMLGHSVTVFEAHSELGGMLHIGIPEYRLPKQVLQKDINEILEQGIELKTNTIIGKELTLDKLKAQGYRAILLAVGAQLSKKLDVSGIELEGVLWGLEFLKAVQLVQEVKVKDRVVVIGGGNVAIDVALTALRLGAKEVQLACLESKEEMPAFEWELQEALAEGVIFNCSWGPSCIVGDGKNVTGIELVQCTRVFDEERKFNPIFNKSVCKTIETDMVIIAIGQVSDPAFLGKDGAIRVTEAGALQVDNTTLETSQSGIFAAGDAVSGAASVIEAIAMGRKAASSIDRYLGGDGIIDIVLVEREEPNPRLGREEGFAERARIQTLKIPLEQRKASFAEVELSLDKRFAVEEAKRCLQCDLRLQISQPILPPEKWLEFNSKNLSTIPELEGVYQLLDKRKTIIYIKGTVNLRKELEEQLKTNVKARYFGYEEEPMYTKRETELLQQFLQQHGKLPEGNEELEELF